MHIYSKLKKLEPNCKKGACQFISWSKNQVRYNTKDIKTKVMNVNARGQKENVPVLTI